jgi:hypothetical protein
MLPTALTLHEVAGPESLIGGVTGQYTAVQMSRHDPKNVLAYVTHAAVHFQG